MVMYRTGLLFVLAVVVCGCGLGPRFGVLRVDVGSERVYFIREVRGLNYDSLVISATDDLCQELDGPANFVFESLGPIRPYYTVVAGVLHIYTTYPGKAPSGQFPVTVVQHELGPLEWVDFDKTAQERGLRQVVVEPTSSKWCW